MATRAFAGIEGHDLRFDLSFDFAEECLHLGRVNLGHLIFHNGPRDRVQIATVHLHAKTAALDDRGPATHEDVGDPEILEGAFLLMVRIVNVPDQLRWLRRILPWLY